MTLPILISIVGGLVALFSTLLVKNWVVRVCIVLLSLSIGLTYFVVITKLELIDTKRVYEQAKADSERWKVQNASCREQLKVQGANTGGEEELRSVENFKNDWDWSNFYLVGVDTFCPKRKGGNHYQRMEYKYDTPLAGSNLDLKFQMVNEDNNHPDYEQRVVVGTTFSGRVFSEFDIPTRIEQVINFRVASESGELVSGGIGKPFGSPIIVDTVINLNLLTKAKNGQNMTQVITLDYISTYGDEHKKIDYDAETGDSHPETARTHLIIGSYVGGCIKVIGWRAN